MKLSLRTGLLAVTLLVGSLASTTSAQQSGVLVAVIDVPKVFEMHPDFKGKMEAIQESVKAFEAQILEERKALAKSAERLKELNPSSPEYKRLEEELAKSNSDIAVKFQLKRKEVLEQEAKQYFETYNQILGVVQAVADRHKIGLVLSYDSKPIDQNDLNSVARGVNRPIVYQRNLDITQLVLQELGSGGVTQRPAAGQPLR